VRLYAGIQPFWAADESLEDKLKRLQIREFSKDLLAMDLQELRQHFGFVTTGGIRMNLYIRNILWQLYRQVQAGHPPPFLSEGANIRSIWYHIKAKTSQHRATQGDHYGMVSTQLKLLVVEGLAAYRDFNLADDDKAYRKLAAPDGNPHIILIGEKRAYFPRFVEFAETYGVTVQMTQGKPSLLTVDTLVAELDALGIDLKQEFVVVTFVDFDPDGHHIPAVFAAHLKIAGIRQLKEFKVYKVRTRWFDMARPVELDKETINKVRYRLKARVVKKDSTKVWGRNTGGVDGKGSYKYGISADSFLEILPDLVSRAVTPELRVPPEDIARVRAFQKLSASLEAMILEKVLHP